MISQTAEYALRAVVCLAEAEGRRSTTAQIAEATHVPRTYLSKVLDTLSRAGLVSGRRGPGGGFTLQRDPAEITALQVISAVDPLKRIPGCPLDLPEHSQALCPLHQQLDDATAAAEAALRRHTIADLLAKRQPGLSAAHFPTDGV